MARASVRIAVGVVLLVAWSGFREIRLARANLWAIHSAVQGALPDSFAVNQARFAVLRRDLPADQALGYASDIPRDMPDNGYQTAFVQTQYAFAPDLIFDSDTLSRILGNFVHAPPDSAGLAAMGLRLVHDYGRGVLLLSRGAP
ncbi:MAG: hypothetical protein WBQ26_10145 [Gemmatimonadaceae bacterium]|nr:hypothetical protein [Gemmatimonadaceae bacterium]